MKATTKTSSKTLSANKTAVYAHLGGTYKATTEDLRFAAKMAKVEVKFLRCVRGAFIGKSHGDISEEDLAKHEQEAKKFFKSDYAFEQAKRMFDEKYTIKDMAYSLMELHLIPEYC